MKSSHGLIGLFVFGYLGLASPAAADVVTDWNATAVQSVLSGVPARAGGSSFLDFAMVQLAMHDAIQAFEKRYESYGAPIPNATGSPIAAAAAAAHDVLVNRFPAQAGSLDTALQNYLSGLGLQGDPGVTVGQAAAAQIIHLRVGDGSWPSNPETFTGGTQPGEWRPTPPAFAPMAVPWLGAVATFAVNDSSQLLPDGPPALTSDEYTKDYNEVKALGRATNSARTAEQTALAVFYTDNLVALGERTMRGVASTLGGIGDSARLLALANMATADTVITTWNAKRSYNFWRPITAIQLGDSDGNPATAGDPTWAPLIATPPYQDYTSGANSFYGSFTRTLALLLGDKTSFTVTSLAVNQTKTYARFSDLAEDMINVRIYQGIHFRTADRVARQMGMRSADWAVSHFLRPVREQ